MQQSTASIPSIPSVESGHRQLPQEINEDDIVVTNQIRKSYTLQDGREVTVLRNITLDNTVESFPIKRGEFLIIRGPSGSGKTSLLNIIGTIDQPTSGTLYLFGQEVKKEAKDKELANIRLQHVPLISECDLDWIRISDIQSDINTNISRECASSHATSGNTFGHGAKRAGYSAAQ